jgi:hypothetical protein
MNEEEKENKVINTENKRREKASSRLSGCMDDIRG